MDQDPWLLQVAVLGGTGTGTHAPRHWCAVQRHVVNDFAQGHSTRDRAAVANGGSAASLLRQASDLEIVEHLRAAGPLTIAQLAMRLDATQPVAWERMHGIARRGLVRRQSGAWCATLLAADVAEAA